MEPLTPALRLLQRQAELQEQRRQPGGIRVTQERELFQLRAHLERFPPRHPCGDGGLLPPASAGGSALGLRH